METELRAVGDRVLSSWRKSLVQLETEISAVGDRVKGIWRQSSAQLEKEFLAQQETEISADGKRD